MKPTEKTTNKTNSSHQSELRYLHSYRFDVKGTQLPSTENTAPNESSPTQADSEDLDLEGKKNPEEEALLKSNKRRMTRPVVENNERKRSIGNTITIAFSEKADKIRRIKEWIGSNKTFLFFFFENNSFLAKKSHFCSFFSQTTQFWTIFPHRR